MHCWKFNSFAISAKEQSPISFPLAIEYRFSFLDSLISLQKFFASTFKLSNFKRLDFKSSRFLGSLKSYPDELTLGEKISDGFTIFSC